MNDDIGKIPSIGSKPKKVNKDRGELSVQGKEKKKTDFGLIAIVLATVAIPVGALFYFSGGDDKKEVARVVAKTEYASEEAMLTKDEKKSNFTLDNLMTGIIDRNARNAQEKADAERVAEERVMPEPIITTNVQRNEFKPETLHTTVITTSADDSTEVKKEVSQSELRKLGGGVMALIDGNDKGGDSAATGATGATGGVGGALGQFSNTFDSPQYKEGEASVANVSKQDFLLQNGTNIPCVLKTKIVSTYAGLVSCSVISDVYSANGTTLLVEKGSTVSGNQSLSLAQGQARLFVTWGTIKTPEGVSIKIDSLGTDSLGASGVGAWVDNHFKERFGGTIMLSFLDDAFATLANKTADSDSNVSTDSTSDAASDIASIALENSINIPPTGYVNIGERLNILIARDIDMSSVYEIQPY